MPRLRKPVLSLAFAATLGVGMTAAFGTPSSAQITVSCWKTVCVTNPETKQVSCISTSIPCPPEENEVVTP
ncbi:MAG TPA: hypothetical protein VF665_22205 [Longimicrobium sp.]|jgi:hypothetical protein|uniref:hypothetical protein n=1 Tax=Longimicrobium sp. TaxID=2029185 RepID=UPI002EDB981E